MPSPSWPATLPQTPRRSTWAGGPMDFRRKFVPDRGDAIVRRATTAEVMSYQGVVFPNLKSAQLATFEAFYRDDLKGGTIPYLWNDPVTGTSWLWRIDGDGALAYRVTSKGAGLHDLTVNLIRRPGAP